ncbi:MBL fold metallo-hydrolase [Sphaerisporangium album]|uniref:MBL fold metallo-hydrolase n=1 Tax=Sphaerisporangium album TaxID=509200 RepID=A0A367FPF7_9ACTN|nr:MBL fold metallo-hydrolase [Sphaerisporangium album]RCG31570.1 MBL fold metallo-hydrolase [Sphaerisporangium album]
MKNLRRDKRDRYSDSESDTESVGRGDVEDAVRARTTKKIEKAVADKDRLKKRRVEEDVPLDEGRRGDGVFYLTFLQMGQGDGAIMSTPRGKTVMIDCGTVSTDGESESARGDGQAILKKDIYLGGGSRIDILILTHPDRDHYSWVEQLTPDNVTFGKVYHSDSLGEYSFAKTRKFLKRHVASRNDIRRVRNNRSGRQLAKVDVPARTADGQIDVLVDGGIRILDEPDCKMTILAAEVPKTHADEIGLDAINAGSVVTLIEVYNEKILIVGDATYSTETFLMDRHRDRIRNLDLLQVGHHGSACTSSLQSFIDLTQPKMAIICAGRAVETNHLPRGEVVWRYHDHLDARADIAEVDAHDVYFWRKHTSRSGFAYEHLNMTVPLQSTGTGRFDYFIDPPRGAPADDGSGDDSEDS